MNRLLMGRMLGREHMLAPPAIWLAMHKSNFEQQAEERARKEQACQEREQAAGPPASTVS